MTQHKNAPGFEKHPDHKLVISPDPRFLEVVFAGTVIARSGKVQLLEEGNYPPRLYFPLSDVKTEFLTAVDTSTYCPFKGDARYWQVKVGDVEMSDGAWGYDDPYQECAEIADHVCFYLEKSPFELNA